MAPSAITAQYIVYTPVHRIKKCNFLVPQMFIFSNLFLVYLLAIGQWDGGNQDKIKSFKKRKPTGKSSTVIRVKCCI